MAAPKGKSRERRAHKRMQVRQGACACSSRFHGLREYAIVPGASAVQVEAVVVPARAWVSCAGSCGPGGIPLDARDRERGEQDQRRCDGTVALRPCGVRSPSSSTVANRSAMAASRPTAHLSHDGRDTTGAGSLSRHNRRLDATGALPLCRSPGTIVGRRLLGGS
jgi:hypothetical protein